MDVFIKTLRNVFKFDKNYWLTVFAQVFILVISERTIRKELNSASFIYWVSFLIVAVIISFWIFFIKNYISKNWLDNHIKILPIPREDSYDGKVLLRIENDNYGDELTNVRVELLRLIPCGRDGKMIKGGNGEYAERVLNIKDKSFPHGLRELSFIIKDQSCAVVEIAEDVGGVLNLLFPSPFSSDWLLGNVDVLAKDYWGLKLWVVGKIADFNFSRELIWKISHEINHAMIEVFEDDSRKPVSKVEWVLLPENG